MSMNKIYPSILTILFLALVPTVAIAQDPSSIPTADPGILIQAMQSGYWVLIVWGIILGGIYAIKMLPDKYNIWGMIPMKIRPLVVIALGVVSAVGQAVLAKQPWLPVLVTNIMAAFAAIGTDKVQSKLREDPQSDRNEKTSQ